MRSDRLIFTAVFLLGLGLVLAYAVYELRPGPLASKRDVPGARLEVTVAGKANGKFVIKLFDDVAPKNAARLKELAAAGAYDGVVFHRVIGGFMAQTGDVKYGREGGDLARAGSGGSDLPDLPLEASKLPFERGVVGMARTSSPNSANSQFFIMFKRASHLDGGYTVVGQVVEGMDVVDAIKRGDPQTGLVAPPPDVMKTVRVIE